MSYSIERAGVKLVFDSSWSFLCCILLLFALFTNLRVSFGLYNRDVGWFRTRMQRARAKSFPLHTKTVDLATLWERLSTSIPPSIHLIYPSARVTSRTLKNRCKLGLARWWRLVALELQEEDRNRRRKITGKTSIRVGTRRKRSCNSTANCVLYLCRESLQLLL